MENEASLLHRYPHQPLNLTPHSSVAGDKPRLSSQHPASSAYPRTRSSGGSAAEPQMSNIVALAAMEELYELERSEVARRLEYEAKRNEAIRRAEAGLGVSISGPHIHGIPSAYTHVQHFAPGHHHHYHHQHAHHPYAHPNAGHHNHTLLVHPPQKRDHEHETEESPSPTSTDSESLPQMPGSTPTYPRSPPGHSSHVRHPYPTYHQPPGAESAPYTPSTSPFLGGIRQLGIHSSTPSRVPSPVLLPPPSLAASTNSSVTNSQQTSPTMHYSPMPQSGAYTNSNQHSANGYSHTHGHHHLHTYSHPHHPYAHSYKRRSFGEHAASSTTLSPTLSPTRPSFPGYPYSSDRTLPRPVGKSSSGSGSGSGTPALSSGPSSTGSSPGNTHYSLHTTISNASSFRGPPTSAVRSNSNASSRAPSPVLVQNSSNGAGQSQTHHNHLATSLRLAFGMTPIKPIENASAVVQNPNTVSTHSNVGSNKRSSSSSELRSLSALYYPSASHAHGHSYGGKSLPASRAASPPITLPPLQLPGRPSGRPEIRHGESAIADDDDLEMDTEEADESGLVMDVRNRRGEREKVDPKKVVLPHFSEIDPVTAGGLGVTRSMSVGGMDLDED